MVFCYEKSAFSRVIILIGMLIGGWSTIEYANAGGSDDNPAVVNWAISAINSTALADFDKRCSINTVGLNSDGTMDNNASNNGSPDRREATLNPEVNFPKAWIQPCRTITATELAEIFQKVKYNGKITLEGFYLIPDENSTRQSNISSNPQTPLADSDYKISVKLAYAMVDGRFDIDNSHLISLDLQDVYFNGPVNAENLSVDNSLQINNIYFRNTLDFRSLVSPSFFWMGRVQGAPPPSSIIAQNMHVGGMFYYYGDMRVHNADFSNSRFGSWFDFENTVQTTGLQCRSCVIAGNLEFTGDTNLQDNTDDNYLDFSEAQINNDVGIECGAKLDYINLRDTVIGGSFLTVSGANCGIKISALDLSGANISKQLNFSVLNYNTWPSGQKTNSGSLVPVELKLQNAKVGSFADCASSWPPVFQIDGFTYSNIHDSHLDSCKNEITFDDYNNLDGGLSWISWLNRNNPTFDNSLMNIISNNTGGPENNFDPQPYTFLAAYFQSAGRKGLANEIRYQSKFYEMKDDWRQGNHFAAVGTTVLWLVAGFGIGSKAVIHLFLVISASILIGVYILRRSRVIVGDKWMHLKYGRKSKFTYTWCIGACLERLLPIIELRKEFTDFFETEGNLSGFQKTFFVLYSLWGWFLGFLVLAVLSGLTQGS